MKCKKCGCKRFEDVKIHNRMTARAICLDCGQLVDYSRRLKVVGFPFAGTYEGMKYISDLFEF